MKTGIIPHALWIFIVSAAVPAQANEPSFDRESAITLALEQNLDLKVAAFEIAEARARLHWAGLLPNPELELTTQDDFLGESEGERSLEVAFTQRFPVTSKLRDTRELRRRQVEVAQLEFAARQLQLAHDADLAWIALVIARHTAELQNRILQLNDKMVAFLEKRAAVGEASSLDVTQAVLNSHLISQQVAIAQADAQSAASRLQKITGLPPETHRPSSTEVPALPEATPPSSCALDRVLARRADYQALVLQASVGEAQLALAESQRWEDFGVTVFYESERSIDLPEGAGTNHLVGLGLSIPLPLRKPHGAALAEAAVAIARAKTAQEAGVFAIQSEVHATLEARATAHTLAREATGELLTLAQKNLEDTTRAYRSGEVSFLQVQRAQEQLLQLDTSSAELLQAYLEADARVRFATADYPIKLHAPPSPSAPSPSP